MQNVHDPHKLFGIFFSRHSKTETLLNDQTPIVHEENE